MGAGLASEFKVLFPMITSRKWSYLYYIGSKMIFPCEFVELDSIRLIAS